MNPYQKKKLRAQLDEILPVGAIAMDENDQLPDRPVLRV